MALPDSYTIKTGAIPAYFDAMKNAEPPERFSYKFLQDLDFSSSNDRLFVGILKELGFLSQDGVPTERYYMFLDREHSERIIAEGIREAYADLFAVNKDANKLNVDEAHNKLRTLYKGTKKDSVIKNIAKTFVALCEVADFTKSKTPQKLKESDAKDKVGNEKATSAPPDGEFARSTNKKLDLGALQYHINIALPETRDQAVYDAIFKSLRDHLG
jgi:hypothetical protein